MTDVQPVGVTKAAVLAAIERVLGLCRSEQNDSAVAYVVAALERVREAVLQEWPLSAEVKGTIYLGAFAAKNLDDWNRALAGPLMTLDYILKNDGASIEKLGNVA